MTTGIYSIVSPTGRRYIGQSTYIEQRFDWHRERLMRGKHHCVALQHDWNSYRPNRLYLFRWVIIHAIAFNELSSLDDLERYYIRTSKVRTYNVHGADKDRSHANV